MPGLNISRAEARERSNHLAVTSYVVTIDVCQGPENFITTSTVKFSCNKPGYDTFQEPAQVKTGVAVAKKAHALGIAPALYDAFIVFDTDDIKIVKVYEIIKGVPWADKAWKPAAKTKANAELQQTVTKMNRAGIIHHDLHPGNVMVTPKGLQIIDFDRANFAKDEEQGYLPSFNSSFPSMWMPRGIASEKGIKYIYHKLVTEGTIRH